MGKRREPRKQVQVPVRIFGSDCHGRIFSLAVFTVDVSRGGAKLGGVSVNLKIDEIIGVTCGTNKVHFKVKWTGTPGTPTEGHIGLLNLTPQKQLWDFPLPLDAPDNFLLTGAHDRRQSSRIKCSISVELHAPDQTLIWGKASDISLGGCFVEMPTPLALNTQFDLAIWLGETKLQLQGEVVSAAPGFGIGVRFINLSAVKKDYLLLHIQSIS